MLEIKRAAMKLGASCYSAIPAPEDGRTPPTSLPPSLIHYDVRATALDSAQLSAQFGLEHETRGHGETLHPGVSACVGRLRFLLPNHRASAHAQRSVASDFRPQRCRRSCHYH